MSLVLEIFKLPFMQRALIGSLLVGFLAAYYGTFIVQRRLSFLGSGLAHAAFDRELALADHIHVVKDDYILSVLIAVTVVIAIKIVGIVLIAAFLVIPAAAARLFTCRFSRMTLCAIAIGTISVLIGLSISYHLDVPSGAAIILLQALVFFLILVLKLMKIIKAK
jgi:ABC-type Mn2+/Zn2+ transport system permease subunit